MVINHKQPRYAHTEGYTDCCYSSDGKYIITCGDDGDLRIWTGIGDDDPRSIYAGEKTYSVQCIPYKYNDSSNSGRIFVAIDAFCVQAFTFPEGDRDGITARFTAVVSHLTVDKNFKFLAAAAQDMTVKVITLEDEKTYATFTDLKAPALSAALCPKGKFLAVSAGDGLLRIWSLESKTIIKEFECVPKVNNFFDASILCRPSFEPTAGKYFVYPNKSEIIIVDTSTWATETILTDTQAEGEFSISIFSPCGKYIAAGTNMGSICVWHYILKKTLGCFPHRHKKGICSLVWNPTGNGELAYCDKYGQLGTLEDCFLTEELKSLTEENEGTISTFQLDGDDEDNENAISLEKIKAQTTGLLDDDNDETRPSSRSSIQTNVPRILSNLQPPFQPGSSPVHLSERYMVWNEIGVVRAYDGDTSDNGSIEVDFHDTSFHHTMHLINYLNHTMASLSRTVLALACDNTLVSIPLGTGSSKEWKLELNEEEIVCICASEKLIVLATKSQQLRLLTVHGTQREVISVPGPVVSLTACNTSLLVAYHCGLGCTPNDQNLGLLIFHIQGWKVTSTQIQLPLSPSSTLTWLGHTDAGSPVTFDSLGVLRVFAPKSAFWMPLYDNSKHRKGVSDGMFIIEVSEKYQVLRSIVCKGSMFPQITPKPTVSEHQLQIPICELPNDKVLFEEKLVRIIHCLVDEPDKQLKEAALKLFALACRSDLEQRAIEIIELFESEQLLELAVKYASKLGRMHLTDSLTKMAELWQEEGTPYSNEDEDSAVSEIVLNRAVTFEVSKRCGQGTTQSSPNVEAPKPLVLKRNHKRVKIDQMNEVFSDNAATVDETETSNESQILSNDVSQPSLISALNDYNEKPIRNPFSKRIGPIKKKGHYPLDESDQLEQNGNTTRKLNEKTENNMAFGKKRKQPEEPESTEKKITSRQSKLSVFQFTKQPD